MKPSPPTPESYLSDRPVLSTWQRRVLGLVVPVLIGVGGAGLALTEALAPLERLTIDARFRRRGPLKPDPRVVVVEIDEQSRRELSGDEARFDLRAHLGAAIDHLADAGAIVQGVDAWLAGRGDEATDARLAEAIAGANVVLGSAYVASRNVRPASVFLEAGAQEGLVNVEPDADGVLRRIPRHPNLGMAEIEGVQLRQAAHFPFVLAWMVLAEEAWAAGREPPPADFTRPDRAVLMGREVRYGSLVNFAAGPDQGFTKVPFAGVVRGEFDREVIDGAVVLMGDVRSIADQWQMPLAEGLWPGVYYHANVVDQILQDRPLAEWPLTQRAMALLVGVITTLAGWYGWNIQAWWARRLGWLLLGGFFALGAVLFVGGWWWVCQRAFADRLVLPMVAPLVGAGAALLTGLAAQASVTVVSARRLAQRNRQIEALFGRSVSRQVLEAIKADPGSVARIEQREVSVLFCDIRGFTAKSAKLDPQQVARLLNEYFEAITSAVFENDGFVDKFVGDELMAVFGVPLSQPDHALRAVRTALAIKQRLGELNLRRSERGEAALDCGVGIHCGPVAAGHIGTAERASYTVVGDTVNLAARIEGLTAGGEILISAQVYEHVAGAIPARPWQTVELRGSGRRHELFEVPTSAMAAGARGC